MSNIEFVRKRIIGERERSISRMEHYRKGVEGIGFPANYALEMHYEGKVEAYDYALTLLDLLDDGNEK